jgi:hypothetical protein
MLGDGPLYQELHDVFDAEYEPTAVHRLLAQLPTMIRARASNTPRIFPLIITPNYDRACERAFMDAGEPYDLLIYLAEDPDRGRFLHISPDGQSRVITMPNTYTELRFDQRPVIAKIHGAVGSGVEEPDSFVITENDYIDYLRYTDLSQLIFLGYSLKDWNLRVILNRLRDAGVSWNSWAVQPQPDGMEERFWVRRNVELVDARLEAYIGGLTTALLDASSMAQPVP